MTSLVSTATDLLGVVASAACVILAMRILRNPLAPN